MIDFKIGKLYRSTEEQTIYYLEKQSTSIAIVREDCYEPRKSDIFLLIKIIDCVRYIELHFLLKDKMFYAVLPHNSGPEDWFEEIKI